MQNQIINRSFLDELLDSLAIKCKKKFRGQQNHIEIILVGGASIVANYDFRGSTLDADALMNVQEGLEKEIAEVAKEYGMPNQWLNSDFIKTRSYSTKLVQYSCYYKTFRNILDVRTIQGEYLIAMKIVSGRDYKNDLSDICGVLLESRINGIHIDELTIRKAIHELYEERENEIYASQSYDFAVQLLLRDDLQELMNSIRETELANQNDLLAAIENTQKENGED